MVDFIASGTLSQVPDHLIADLVNDCYEPVLGTLKGDDGKYYGVPLEFNIEYGGMLVNKPRFKELGIAYPETWNAVVDIARQTTKKSGNLWTMRGLDFTTDDTLTTTFLSMILSMGGEYWVDGKLKLVTPEAEKALKELVDFVKVDEITNLDSATGAQGDEVEGFDFLGRDEAMMVPRGPWVISELEENYGKTLGVDFDYVKFPFYAEIPAFPAETGWSMCVSKNSAVAEAAWKYLEFFLEHDNLMQHNINCAQVSPRKSVIETPGYVSQMPYLAPLLDIVEYGKFIGPFNTDVLKGGLRNTYMSLCSGDGKYASVGEALADLEKNLNEQLGLK
jgi:multiple sugar transport system substrate-binding protein